MKYVMSIVVLTTLGACTSPSLTGLGFQNADPGLVAVGPHLAVARGPDFAPPVRPALDLAQVRPDVPPPPPVSARTVEQFDTTSAQERAAATSTPTGGAQRLGVTIASLGSPTDPGIWFKTPLVAAMTQGRIVYKGTSVNVELRPSGGAQGSGSQISLAAMRLIGAPLTGLPEVSVYAR